MTKTFFGTDGIRGRFGEYPITPDFALRLGNAAGCVFAKNWSAPGRPQVVIGKDTRISGYLFESALESGLASAGIDVLLLGPMPTPAIAYLTRTFHACAGIVVSASHNPYYDNGIKFFSDMGSKLDDETEKAIETLLNEPLHMVDSKALGKVKHQNDAAGRYIEYCKSTVPIQFNLSGLKIVLDCANGATYHIAPKVFKELRAEVIPIHNKPDGLNINEQCGSTEPASLIDAVKTHSADIGIAFDGDGDRVMLVDNAGNLIDGDQILYLIALGMEANNHKPAGIVGTLMTNMAFEVAMQKKQIGFERANVGDRYVMEILKKNNWTLGGESSGHILCLDKSTTGDGIVAALQVLETLKQSGQTLQALLADYKVFPQTLQNVTLNSRAQLKQVMLDERMTTAIDNANTELQGRGRVLIRASGTEPKIRVMAEAKTQQLVDQYVQQFVQLVTEISQTINE